MPQKIKFFDGGMGTLLQAKGLNTLPEIWNIENPETILEIQTAYAKAGCNILKSNTFGANALKLADEKYTPDQLIAAGIAIAKKAAQSTPTPPQVALDIGPLGKLLSPAGELEFEKAITLFAEMVRAGAKAGADLILIETMSDTYEIKAAMLAAKENSNLPIMVTFSPDENGRLLTGADIQTAAALIESLGVTAVGLNCGFGPTQLKTHLQTLHESVSIPIIFNPNGGMPKMENGKTIFDLTPEDYATQVKAAASGKAAFVGGCCGTTPAHIAAMIQSMKGENPQIKQNTQTRITSYAQTVTLGGEIAIIGERINPTGKAKLKKALREKNLTYLQNEAISQTEQGASLLDVNVGLPGIDEPQMLVEAVKTVQGVSSLPLVIDTSDPAAAEAALRIYNGKPLLNSVNGKQESLDTLLPIAKKYGAAIIALTLDKDGIPETPQARVAIAERIITAATAHGIPKHDIIVDVLTMTLSTNTQNANITLQAVQTLHNQNIRTVLGVSNISFGLPRREILTAAFVSQAALCGLSAAIANPGDTTLTNAIALHKTLSGYDENCQNYVETYANTESDPAATTTATADPLTKAVINGMEEAATAATIEKLKTTDPMQIINENLIPALNQAGQTFSTGKTFLPQLIKSASAATAAFNVINAQMAQSGKSTKKRAKIVIATVENDIHDIGKNIVKTLLQNYNFDVTDLGTNVPPAKILQTVQAENAQIVALSALMTIALPAMEETITLLKTHTPKVKIMVGGAVLTESYAKKIGADFYSPEAMGAVRFAESIS